LRFAIKFSICFNPLVHAGGDEPALRRTIRSAKPLASGEGGHRVVRGLERTCPGRASDSERHEADCIDYFNDQTPADPDLDPLDGWLIGAKLSDC
jgi:hypothetical protein